MTPSNNSEETNGSHLLSIQKLQISTSTGSLLLDFPQLNLRSGEVHAIIGESGSGKSLTLLTTMGLLTNSLKRIGKISFQGFEDLLEIKEEQWLSVRGNSIGMIFQEPMTALNPQITCGNQLKESAKIHGVSGELGEQRIKQKLSDLGLGSMVERIMNSYPHQLSGGQRQRVMIAMACMHDPPLILADEPTTALDSISRKAVMDDLLNLCKKQGSALLWVSHEMDLVAKYADSISVLKKGKLLDQGSKSEVLGLKFIQETNPLEGVHHNQPRTEYVKALMDALPADAPDLRDVKFDSSLEVLSVEAVHKSYKQSKGSPWIALKGINLQLHAGETLALVGLSGSGKSTLAKILVGLESYTSGLVTLKGKKLKAKPPTGVQMVFQDPYSSLNPNQSVKNALMEIFIHGLRLSADKALAASEKALAEVGLEASFLNAWPHELSGGQRQRLCIAKALATEPEVLVLDEAVAALDPIVQKQVLDLLVNLQKQRQIAYVFITHNLHVAKSIAHKIVYLENGILGDLPRSWEQV